MNTTIEVDAEVFAKLQAEAIPLVDTPNDVLRRLLGIDPIDAQKTSGRSLDLPPPLARQPGRQTIRTSSAARSTGSGRSRRAAGELLPLEEYCPYILQALIAHGGELHRREVLNALVPLLEPRLLVEDKQPDASGAPVWHSRVGWAGSMCRKEEHLDRAAPRGIWRITEKGRRAATQAKGKQE